MLGGLADHDRSLVYSEEKMNADKWTDEQLLKIEREINSIYTKANEELLEKSKKHFEQFRKDDEKYKAMVDSGEMSKSSYYRWRKDTLTKGNQYKDLQKQTAFEITRANERATAYVNGRLPSVYVQNYNAIKSDVDRIGGYSFTLTNEDAVKYVYQNIDKNLLPIKKVDTAKDVAWNMKRINSEVLQGILQGESMDKVAGRLQNAGMSSEKAAIRNARTMVTGAQNHGKLDSYYRLKDDGIDIKKRWDATLDKRTREEHAELDGQSVDIDEPFENSIGKIMYPGDPDADPANVYNCRCSLQGDVGQTRGEQRATRDENGRSVLSENMTYEEWYETRMGKPFNVPQMPEIESTEYTSAKLMSVLGSDDYKAFTELVRDADTRTFYDNYMEEVRSIRHSVNGGQYNNRTDSVEFSYETKHEGINKYSTLAHENGHMFDYHIGRTNQLTFNEVDLVNDRCVIGSGIAKTLKVTPSTSDQFLSAVRKDMQNFGMDFRANVEKLKANRNATSGVQDAVDGFFSTQDRYILPWGHGDRYYNRMYNLRVKGFGNEKELKDVYKELGFDASNQTKVKKLSRIYDTASEAWANGCSALTVGGGELEAFETYMPNTLSVIRQIAKGM